MLLGQLAPGDRLCNLSIARELELSRTPVREAITRLASEGFVEQSPRLGTFVKQPTREEMVEICDLRILLEGFTAERASRQASDMAVQRLFDLCEKMRSLGHSLRRDPALAGTSDFWQQWVLSDVAFHLLIAQAAGNSLASAQISDIQIKVNLVRPGVWNPQVSELASIARTWAAHYRIYRAIKNHRVADAKRFMEQHVQAAGRDAIDAIDQKWADRGHLGDRATWSPELCEILDNLEAGGRSIA